MACTPVCVERDSTACAADFDNNGIVGISDFIALQSQTAGAPEEQDLDTYDLTGDGVLSISDLISLLVFYGTTGLQDCED